jgi:hypothetical protein
VERLRTRAHIRRTIVSREHNRENDRIAALLDEAADEIEKYQPLTHQEYLDDKGA